MEMIHPKNNPLLLLFLASLLSLPLSAQEGMKFWAGHSYRTNITKEWRVRAGQLYLFDDRMDLTSMQNSARVDYRFNRNITVGLGYIRSSDPADPDQQARNRIDPRVRYRFKLGKLRIANQLRAEWHFPSRSKFEYRLRYALGLNAGDFGLPMDITPYMTNELHYYLNGRPLNYRDTDGDVIVRQSPNGLHAHRIRIGVRFRPFKRANVSLSFMRQTEFNIGSRFRQINVVDPRDGDILRGFNNFSVLSFSFSYRFKI
ncbi:hypothetical protein FGF1_33010 [Flavobacteriaceae bacterium GF1]